MESFILINKYYTLKQSVPLALWCFATVSFSSGVVCHARVFCLQKKKKKKKELQKLIKIV